MPAIIVLLFLARSTAVALYLMPRIIKNYTAFHDSPKKPPRTNMSMRARMVRQHRFLLLYDYACMHRRLRLRVRELHQRFGDKILGNSEGFSFQ